MELRRRKARQGGNAIIEFALGSAVFLGLFTATYQFGYTYYVYNNLLSAVRAGARFGAITPYDCGTPTVNSSPVSNFVTGVKNVTVYGNPGPVTDAQPRVAGFTTEHVNVNVDFANGLPSVVRVSINNYQINALFGTWTASNKPVAAFTYTGRFAPPE